MRSQLVSAYWCSLVLALLFAIYVVLELMLDVSTKNQNDTTNVIEPTTKDALGSGERPVILLWTTVFGRNLSEGSAYAMCPNRTVHCAVVNDRQLLKSADVVVFHARDLQGDDLLSQLPDPRAKRAGQRWLLWNMEPPRNTPAHVYPQGETIFDLDANYMRDAEIPLAYGYVVRRTQPKIESEAELFARFQRQRGAFWMVSNCHTESNREGYVDELQTYFPVDIYGRCGNLSCDDRRQCAANLSERYMFYLAFENSLCPDYVTEKLYRTLGEPVIPVVLSGSMESGDAALLDSLNAIVDASALTPAQLARRLRQISKDFRLYRRFFEWRRTYVAGINGWYPFCQICDALVSGRLLRARRYNQWMLYDRCRRWDSSLGMFTGVSFD